MASKHTVSPCCTGKTFQCNLAFKKLGISPIVMSAGELESGNAGEPAKLIRQRYREASDVIKKGKVRRKPMSGPAELAFSVLATAGTPRSCSHPTALPLQMCALFINDLDAGAGRMGDATQYTVNNQMVSTALHSVFWHVGGSATPVCLLLAGRSAAFS